MLFERTSHGSFSGFYGAIEGDGHGVPRSKALSQASKSGPDTQASLMMLDRQA